jgi:hypothetical protein
VPVLQPAADATPLERIDVRLEQTCLDAERVLALLRTRGYRLERLELEAPSSCRLEVRVGLPELPLLLARLERIPGVRVGRRP